MLDSNLVLKSIDFKEKIYVAFSGGPDSTALLYLLAMIRNDYDELKLKAIHVNHNLSKNSMSWESHCKKVCSDLNIDLITESIEVVSDGGGIESASRQARYKIFKNLLETNEQILLAHHSDDLAETVFMRLLRGTGADGLEGPLSQRAIGKGLLIRPLLEISKEEILNYLTENNIKFIEDESNKENEFDRNFLRNKVFPLLETRWKNFSIRINNTSSILKNRNKIYSELFNEKFHDLIGNNIELKKIHGLSDSVISDILRYSIKECNIAMPNSKIMKEIIKTFVHSKPGSKSIVRWSRSDKELNAGKITYQKGYIIISKG
ncbi:MAG: tRNA lysidine(34) synthetase TilS [Gammaproteobacteria bacterium]|nr:tRNA lysidine(34) synthetase TilS [Gammaproteobacteria bacterium]